MQRAVTLIEVMIVIAIVGILAVIFLGNSGMFSEPVGDRAVRALEDEGYTEIDILDTGFGGAWNGCGQGDGRSAEFRALNSNKTKTVTGVVCCGTFGKGCTIRH